METIKNVSISELHSFRNHPFKVETNTELCELMRSIEKEGVLVPLLVRTNPYGDGYEVILLFSTLIYASLFTLNYGNTV